VSLNHANGRWACHLVWHLPPNCNGWEIVEIPTPWAIYLIILNSNEEYQSSNPCHLHCGATNVRHRPWERALNTVPRTDQNFPLDEYIIEDCWVGTIEVGTHYYGITRAHQRVTRRAKYWSCRIKIYNGVSSTSHCVHAKFMLKDWNKCWQNASLVMHLWVNPWPE
jgi:hypothetical protein